MSFKDRFLAAETSFLTAVSCGPPALAAFDVEWETLHRDFEQAMDSSLLDSTEVESAYAVASKIAIIGRSFAELEETRANITAHLLDEIDSTLSQLSLEHNGTTISPPRPICEGSILVPHRFSGPYIADAFSWLLGSIHDPYPPSSLKRVWARNAQVTMRAMDDWFKSIRKEIGWVAFTKTHFNGSRAMAIQSAGAVLLDDGDGIAVPFEVQTDLFAIRARLESLFPEERGLAAGLSKQLSHKRPRSKSTSSSITDITTSSLPTSPCVQPHSLADRASTASSSSSRASSRLPSLVFDQSDEEDEKLPEFTALDDCSIRIAGDLEYVETRGKLIKHMRQSYYSLDADTSLLSLCPDPFADDHFAYQDHSSPRKESQVLSSETYDVVTSLSRALPTVGKTTPCNSRKRCHEDGELEVPAPKRPRHIRDLPQSSTRKEQEIHEPVTLSAEAFPTTVEEPLVINWEELLRDLDEPTSWIGGDCSDDPVGCGIFDFTALEPAASANIAPVEDWGKLFSAESLDTTSTTTIEELFASFTNIEALAKTKLLVSADETSVSIELPENLSVELGATGQFPPESPADESSSSTPSPMAHAGPAETNTLASMPDDALQLSTPSSYPTPSSIFELLSCSDSVESFDTFSSPFVPLA